VSPKNAGEDDTLDHFLVSVAHHFPSASLSHGPFAKDIFTNGTNTYYAEEMYRLGKCWRRIVRNSNAAALGCLMLIIHYARNQRPFVIFLPFYS
jgi:hypothetical protein